MEKFATLEPVRLYPSAANSGTRALSRNKLGPSPRLVGRLPTDLYLLILAHLPVPDFPAYSRCCRSTAALAQDEKLWESRWKALGVDVHKLDVVLDDLEAKSRGQAAASRAAAPPTIAVDDDFGDFATADVLGQPPSQGEMGDFVGAFSNVALATQLPSMPTKKTFRSMFIRAHTLLKPLTKVLSSPPHLILSNLSASLSSPSLRQEALMLRLLSLYLSPRIQPLRNWAPLYSSLRSAMDRFDANLLAAFDVADSKGDEPGMREAAESSWELSDGSGDWEMGKVWADKREIFYESGKWNPLDNFTYAYNLLHLCQFA